MFLCRPHAYVLQYKLIILVYCTRRHTRWAGVPTGCTRAAHLLHLPAAACPCCSPARLPGPPLCCRVLGTGHYGVTYLCASLKTGAHVAIKALDKLHPEYERDLAIEEILILAAVSDHPNVVDMHEVWEDASYIYIVMVGARLALACAPSLMSAVLDAGACVRIAEPAQHAAQRWPAGAA